MARFVLRLCKLLPIVSFSLIVLISNHKYIGDCWAQESGEDATEVTLASEIRTVNTGFPTQFFDVDGREYLNCLDIFVFRHLSLCIKYSSGSIAEYSVQFKTICRTRRIGVIFLETKGINPEFEPNLSPNFE